MSNTSEREEDNRRRSWTISLIVHALLLLLALIPFLVTSSQSEFAQVIAIRFEDSATKKSGQSQAGRTGSEGAAREVVALASLRPKQTAQSVPVPQQRDILTAPEPSFPIRPPKDTYFDDPLEVTEISEIDQVEEMQDVVSEDVGFSDFQVELTEDPVESAGPVSFDDLESGEGKGAKGSGNADDWFNDLDGVADSGAEDPFADGFFSGEWPGDGRGSQGSTSGVGNDGKSMRWGEFSGDGLFNRKVIHRANVARLAVKQGKIVIKLCVDRKGDVVWVKYDRENSSLHNLDFIDRAENTAKEYLFEEDASAPQQQCGQLTFIFKIEK